MFIVSRLLALPKDLKKEDSCVFLGLLVLLRDKCKEMSMVLLSRHCLHFCG